MLSLCGQFSWLIMSVVEQRKRKRMTDSTDPIVLPGDDGKLECDAGMKMPATALMGVIHSRKRARKNVILAAVPIERMQHVFKIGTNLCVFLSKVQPYTTSISTLFSPSHSLSFSLNVHVMG